MPVPGGTEVEQLEAGLGSPRARCEGRGGGDGVGDAAGRARGRRAASLSPSCGLSHELGGALAVLGALWGL